MVKIGQAVKFTCHGKEFDGGIVTAIGSYFITVECDGEIHTFNENGISYIGQFGRPKIKIGEIIE